MKYVCEYCGKQHKTAQACKVCESKCKAEANAAWTCVKSINNALETLKGLNIPALIAGCKVTSAEYSCKTRRVYIEADDEQLVEV